MKIDFKALIKNKYALIALAVGIVILLWPTGTAEEPAEPALSPTDIEAPVFSLPDEEQRLERQLAQIKGAGRVSVLLSVQGSVARELADNGEEALVLSDNGSQRVVELYYVNPAYMGAVVVCQGADSAKVRLEITQAVIAFTGLSSDKIKVIEMA
jgi:stage III sporulation protein AG